MTRIEIIRRSLAAVGGRRYLEIGVKEGICFRAIDAETKVAVDPRFAFRPPLRGRLRTALRRTSGELYFPTTSDSFFARHGSRLAPFDVVFVDGLHTAEQAHRDIVNALELLGADGIVVVHDCNPQSAAAAAPTLVEAARTDGFVGDWNGDVYRAIIRLRTRDDLVTSVLDTDQGVALVRWGRPLDRLGLSTAEVDGLGYAELDRDRHRLLGLRPATDLDELLAGKSGH